MTRTRVGWLLRHRQHDDVGRRLVDARLLVLANVTARQRVVVVEFLRVPRCHDVTDGGHVDVAHAKFRLRSQSFTTGQTTREPVAVGFDVE